MWGWIWAFVPFYAMHTVPALVPFLPSELGRTKVQKRRLRRRPLLQGQIQHIYLWPPSSPFPPPMLGRVSLLARASIRAGGRICGLARPFTSPGRLGVLSPVPEERRIWSSRPFSPASLAHVRPFSSGTSDKGASSTSKPPLIPGNGDSFVTVSGRPFVDKSEFVRTILEGRRKLFIPGWRRFGKTWLLKMTEAACQGRYGLFKVRLPLFRHCPRSPFTTSSVAPRSPPPDPPMSARCTGHLPREGA